MKNKNNRLKDNHRNTNIIIWVVTLIIATIILFIFVSLIPKKDNTTSTTNKLSTITSLPTASILPEEQSDEISDEVLKENMFIYRDEDFGIEFLVPKTTAQYELSANTEIDYDGKEYHPIYRNDDYTYIEVPNQVIKDTDKNYIYIEPEYTRYCDDNGDFKNVERTLEIIRNDYVNEDILPWTIRLYDVEDINDVEKIIQEVFDNDACKYIIDEDNPMEIWNEDDEIYNINFNWLPNEEIGKLGCMDAGYAYKLYSPEKHKFVIIQHGQDAHFWYTDESGAIIYNFYDELVLNSIRFL